MDRSDHVHHYEFAQRDSEGYSEQRQSIWFVEFVGEKNDVETPTEEVTRVEWTHRNDVIEKMTFEAQRDTYRKVLSEWDTEID
ncbi:hypothetical protein [Halostagnicola kamekurae]|uniref:NUDIX domain-containing protein n=1 Tax=Halostagnicola kamekurae TaxID=619731 RepID=A0A1I6P087_9EURY|nr:hypothetical protein [Halostagnicola kamekurae]SFS33609.1 hypothetical protein SAMN04488556_0240 [Halostagnicola kamekurae]